MWRERDGKEAREVRPRSVCAQGASGWGGGEGSLCWELPWITSSWEGWLLPILRAPPASPNSGSKSELLFNLP